MPPLYVWQHIETEEQIEVLRSFDDYAVEPTPEEIAAAKKPEGAYRKVMGTGIKVRKTNAWGFGKSYWGSKTPGGRGRQ